MAQAIDLAAILGQLPELDPARDEKDKKGQPVRTATGMSSSRRGVGRSAEGFYDAVFSAGKEAIVELIGMVGRKRSGEVSAEVSAAWDGGVCVPAGRAGATGDADRGVYIQLGGDQPAELDGAVSGSRAGSVRERVGDGGAGEAVAG